MIKKIINNDKVDWTLSDILYEYADRYYVTVDYTPKGVSVWIGSEKDSFLKNAKEKEKENE